MENSQINNKMDTHVSSLKGNSEHQHVLIFWIHIFFLEYVKHLRIFLL